MNEANRFQDAHYRLSHFGQEVLLECPGCAKKAVATVHPGQKMARLSCTHCGYNKQASTALGKHGVIQASAHFFFDAPLWLRINFREHVLWAYNLQHLLYLEQYIAAGLREHKERTGFTMVEKLPKFIQLSENRKPLLKLIQKLKEK